MLLLSARNLLTRAADMRISAYKFEMEAQPSS
jgi:hypothetical protein